MLEVIAHPPLFSLYQQRHGKNRARRRKDWRQRELESRLRGATTPDHIHQPSWTTTPARLAASSTCAPAPTTRYMSSITSGVRPMLPRKVGKMEEVH